MSRRRIGSNILDLPCTPKLSSYQLVRRHASIACLCLAWLCANGTIWDAVQVVAWGKMFATYSSYLTTWKALEKTFDGSKPCEICSIAQHGRDASAKQQAAVSAGEQKIFLTCEPVPPVVLSSPNFCWPGALNGTGSMRTESVPVPPPRV